MILNVKVNMPQNKNVLYKKTAETLARIFVNKFKQKEISKLIDILGQEDFKISL